jgi:hypothetical protein
LSDGLLTFTTVLDPIPPTPGVAPGDGIFTTWNATEPAERGLPRQNRAGVVDQNIQYSERGIQIGTRMLAMFSKA